MRNVVLTTAFLLVCWPIQKGFGNNAFTGGIVDPSQVSVIEGANTPEGKKTQQKLDSIILHKAVFDRLAISAVVDFLNIKSKELDPQHVGIKFRLELDPGPHKTARTLHREVTLTIDEVPLGDLLAYICVQTNLAYRIEKSSVVLYLPKG